VKNEIASMDLVALVQELQVLEDARIDKFYQRDNELIIHVYNPGDKKYRLFMTSGKAFFTDYKREMPDRPPGFCMFLRKRLGGATIERIEQYDFDRVLEIHTTDHVLICELFRGANFILTNKNMAIQNAMTTGEASGGRAIHQGEQYEYPGADDAAQATDEVFDQHADEEIVVVLAAEIGLGGSWAEEVCARAGVDKNTEIAELGDDELDTVIETVNGTFHTVQEGDLEPRVYYTLDEAGNEDPVAATPIPFETYSDVDSTGFDTFSEALDTYFTEKEKAEYRRQQLQAYREKKEKLERRLEQQERQIEGLEVAVEENQEKGDLIYEHYSVVEDVIDTIRTAQEQYSNTEITERLNSEKAEGIPEAEAIERLDLDQQEVVVDLGQEVRIDVSKDVERNAEYYYEKSKTATEKIEGAETALNETRRELEELEKDSVDVEQAFTNKAKKQAEKKWYEKFRWFISSDGYLVIGGRDTTTNDMLVKKYMEDHDIYVHAEFTGAPSVVIRTDGDEDIPESTLEEAGQFAVTFARSWDAGVTAEDAYWVHPDQVTQEPESGEYLPKGSFVIRGDRNYMTNLPVRAAVGAHERDDGTTVAMGGPVDAIERQCDHYVVIAQGREKPSDVAKTIQHHLHETTGEDFDLDRIIRALPPGKAAVAEKH
jgi:predicted ribosome quality control (RQC) complex YloA/Tae2 family protein